MDDRMAGPACTQEERYLLTSQKAEVNAPLVYSDICSKGCRYEVHVEQSADRTGDLSKWFDTIHQTCNATFSNLTSRRDIFITDKGKTYRTVFHTAPL